MNYAAFPAMLLAFLFALVRNAFRLPLAPLRLAGRARACPKGAWVQLIIDGSLIELHRPKPKLPWLRRHKPTGLALDRLRELVDELIADEKPAGLLVTIKSMHAPAAYRTALRAELVRLRQAGRPVVVHLPSGGSSPELLVASAASRILLGAQTTLGPLGFHVGSLYFREALDKAGLTPDVHAEGAYKTAGESLSRSSMSEPQREQLGRLLDVLHDELVSSLAEARRVAPERARAWIDQGLVDADSALAEGLADAVVHDDEVLHLLAGPRSDEPAHTVGAGTYLQRRTEKLFVPVLRRPVIAVIEAHGPIVEHAPGRVGAFCDASKIIKLLEQAERDGHVVGVVLHVDSPGGGVLASEKIHRAVSRLARKKPVVSCMAGVSASGGYYVSVACQSIVARPTTITGSIGVVAARVLAGPLLEKIGVRPEVIRRGAHADMLSMTRPFDEEETRIFEAELDRAYKHFLKLVADGRRKPESDIVPLAGGRVWTGQDAHERGLVDRLGGLPEALDEVRHRAGPRAKQAEAALLEPPPRLEPPSLLQLIPGLSDSARVKQLVEIGQALAGAGERVLALLPLWPLP